ncbi:hypothetical protein K438DRAFT_735393 [Mycena galopus ATCC 62051]|nr:hypothetical protein K438DRAFT_735393 [Mycena galopus ATCC 62051]
MRLATSPRCQWQRNKRLILLTILCRYSLVLNLPFLVRASPPCPELYRDLWSIGPILPLLEHMQEISYHISKWVESFSDPTLELIAFWRQCMSSAEEAYNVADYSLEDSQQLEDDWRRRIQKLDDTLAGWCFPFH